VPVSITIQVESDLPITDSTFHPKFKLFEIEGPGEETIYIRHHFSLPDIADWDLDKEEKSDPERFESLKKSCDKLIVPIF
jgi:hypothetical protein